MDERGMWWTDVGGWDGDWSCLGYDHLLPVGSYRIVGLGGLAFANSNFKESLGA